MNEEQRVQIARDEEIARQWDEEERQRAMSEAKTSKKIDWNDPSVIRYHTLKMKPKTVAQARKNMIKYLKNQGNYKISDFKGMSYNEIRPIFEKVWDFNQHIEPMDVEHGSEKMKSSEKIEEEDVATQKEMKEVSKESGAKRKKSIPRKSTRKRQKMEEDAEKEELKGFLDIIPREEVPIEVESLSTKFPIVDWKTCVLTENFMYYQIFRGDGSSKNYKILSEMLEDFDRQDVEELYRLVKERYSTSRPEGYDLMLWGDLHTLFEPDEEDELWKNQHEYNVISWSLYDFCGIHILLMQNGIAIHMLTEKKYPLSQEMISKIGLFMGIESIEPAKMGELNASAMEVEGLMSQVSTSIHADVVRSKASNLSTINGNTSEFAGSLNIQPGLQYAGDKSSYTALGSIYITESSKLTGTMFAVYVMKDANVANVVEEQKHVSYNDHVACEKKVEEFKGFKGAALHGWYYMHLRGRFSFTTAKSLLRKIRFEDVQDVQVLKLKTKLIIQLRKITKLLWIILESVYFYLSMFKMMEDMVPLEETPKEGKSQEKFLERTICIVLGLKRLHGFLEVTAARVHNGNYAKCAAGGKITTVRNQSRFRINKWYQSLALRNFDLEDMELESTNSGPTARVS
ncbi:hypothetical protein Tco_1293746 [Tanacetum coccineum]